MRRKPKPKTLGDLTETTVKSLRAVWMFRAFKEAGMLRTDRFTSETASKRIDNVKHSYDHGKESRQTR